jgi:hypothetical protein
MWSMKPIPTSCSCIHWVQSLAIFWDENKPPDLWFWLYSMVDEINPKLLQLHSLSPIPCYFFGMRTNHLISGFDYILWLMKPIPNISIATNTGWVFNTRFLQYLIHNCAVLRTNNRYWAQCVHSYAARESRYIIQCSTQESWIVVKFVTLF